MRQYNHDTDFHLLVEARDLHGENLTGVKNHLEANGVQWPKNFNSDTSPEVMRLDADIMRSWNRY